MASIGLVSGVSGARCLSSLYVRLGKHLAHAGVASRRASERLVAEGRVTVWGETVRDPAREVADGADVAVDGKRVCGFERRVVYALNKPIGVLSTAHDPYGRETVLSFVQAAGRRLYPVGRLDRDSTGLILITNDGELAHALTHPRFEVQKTYEVTVAGGPVSEGALKRLRAGVALEDGLTAPAQVRRLAPGRLEITIHEGRNREVRRMCDAVGHPVKELMRVKLGPLKLGDLRLGGVRKLTQAEVEALRRAAGMQGRRSSSRSAASKSASTESATGGSVSTGSCAEASLSKQGAIPLGLSAAPLRKAAEPRTEPPTALSEPATEV